MRFLAAQFDALLTDDLWLRCATQANAMAARLAKAIERPAGADDHAPGADQRGVRDAARRPPPRSCRSEFPFYVWDERTGEVRWMCSWDTTEDDVDDFSSAIRALLLD